MMNTFESQSVHVMMLAAGLGKRLSPFTNQIPKPAIPFLGAPLISYGLRFLEDIQIKNLVVNTHHLPEHLAECVHKLKPKCENLVFSPEKEILDSGGGIHRALDHLSDNESSFLVLNADEVILPHYPGLAEELLEFHSWTNGIATLLTMSHPEAGKKFGGVWCEKEKDQSDLFEVKKFGKVSPNNLSADDVKGKIGLHYLGVMVLSPRVRKYFSGSVERPQVENILYDVLTRGLKAGEKIHAFKADVEWFEVGNTVDFLEAESRCKKELQANVPSHNLEDSISRYWVEYLRRHLSEVSDPKTFPPIVSL
jgi:mannose-1-phosphate guanylyltransferase